MSVFPSSLVGRKPDIVKPFNYFRVRARKLLFISNSL